MSAAKHLMDVIRDRKINVLMLEPGEDCTELILDLLPTLSMLRLAGKYQNLKHECVEAVRLGREALDRILTEHEGLWQPGLRDAVVDSLDSAVELNKRLQMRHILRAMDRLAHYSDNMAVL